MEFYEINGYPNYRLVRESKRDFHVESCKRGGWKRIGSSDDAGHINLCISNEIVNRSTSLHVIIAETFVPNSEGKTVVHHIDFDASNNDPSNLLWVSPSEHAQIHTKGEKNQMYGKHFSDEHCRKISEGNKGKNLGRLKPEGSGTPPRAVEQLELDGTTLIARYKSMCEAERATGIKQGGISACCRGKRPTAGGYKWRYEVCLK